MTQGAHRKQEFDPQSLRVVGKLFWMKDSEDAHWFSVPNSNEQLVFSEDGRYVHALTGIAIEIIVIDAHSAASQGAYEVSTSQVIRSFNPFDIRPWPDRVLFSDLVRRGLELYDALSGTRFEFWTTDPDSILQWRRDRVIVLEIDADGSELAPRVSLRRDIPSLVQAINQNLRSRFCREKARYEKRDESKKLAWAEKKDRIKRIRSMPEFDEWFELIYGKKQSEISKDNDPPHVVYCARKVAEYRLICQGLIEAA